MSLECQTTREYLNVLLLNFNKMVIYESCQLNFGPGNKLTGFQVNYFHLTVSPSMCVTYGILNKLYLKFVPSDYPTNPGPLLQML